MGLPVMKASGFRRKPGITPITCGAFPAAAITLSSCTPMTGMRSASKHWKKHPSSLSNSFRKKNRIKRNEMER